MNDAKRLFFRFFVMDSVGEEIFRILTRNDLQQNCSQGSFFLVRAALARGEDVNGVSMGCQTGLMCAVMRGHNSIVRLLLEQTTVDLNFTDNSRSTTLHYAAECDNFEAVRLLLSDSRLNCVNLKDRYGKTPVMNAMFYKKENVLRELVANPTVDLDTRDGKWRSLEEVAR